MRLALIIIAAFVLASGFVSQAQTVDARLPTCQPSASAASFEVASVRRVPASRQGFTKFGPPNTDRFTVENLSLRNLIATAYGISTSHVENKAAWLDDTFYDVNAKAEHPVTHEEAQPMLQRLLQDRFHLQCHFEARQLSGYALVVASGGPKLTPHGTAVPGGSFVPGGMHAFNISAKTIAAFLEHPAGKPIEDETGLEGKYDVHLSFAPEDAPDSTAPSLFTALQEQLGLKLIPRKVTIQVLVVDHADQDPTEN